VNADRTQPRVLTPVLRPLFRANHAYDLPRDGGSGPDASGSLRIASEPDPVRCVAPRPPDAGWHPALHPGGFGGAKTRGLGWRELVSTGFASIPRNLVLAPDVACAVPSGNQRHVFADRPSIEPRPPGDPHVVQQPLISTSRSQRPAGRPSEPIDQRDRTPPACGDGVIRVAISLPCCGEAALRHRSWGVRGRMLTSRKAQAAPAAPVSDRHAVMGLVTAKSHETIAPQMLPLQIHHEAGEERGDGLHRSSAAVSVVAMQGSHEDSARPVIDDDVNGADDRDDAAGARIHRQHCCERRGRPRSRRVRRTGRDAGPCDADGRTDLLPAAACARG
jgi:hypothetical protein